MDVEPSRGSPSQAPALFLNVSYCQPMTGAGAAGVGGPGEAVSQALGRRILEVLGWGPRMLQGPSCRGSGPLDGTHVTRLWAARRLACHQALAAEWLEGEHWERLEV